MPEVKEYTVYKFDELSDAAKERARDWWKEHVFSDSHDWEYVFDEAVRFGALLGIDIDRRSVRTMGGGTVTEPTIYFSGFSSQGDGACFEGDYAYAKGARKALLKEIGGESDGDKTLLRIADALQALQRKNFYRLTARMRHDGHYNHSGCMSVDVDGMSYDGWNIDTEADLRQLMRAFADWIYRQLEAEYEAQMEDETVDDNITANEYTFDINGKRED